MVIAVKKVFRKIAVKRLNSPGFFVVVEEFERFLYFYRSASRSSKRSLIG